MPILSQALDLFVKIASQIKRRWYVVAISEVVCVALVLLWGSVATPIYVTTMTVTAPPSSSSGLGGAIGALGGAASALGLSVGVGQGSQFDSYLALLQSDVVSEKLVENPRILNLMFGKAVDPTTGTWRDTFTRRVKSSLYGVFGLQRQPKPTADDVQFALSTMLVINADPLNRNMVTISCSSVDPPACRDILLAVDRAAQARLDEIALDSAHRMTAYLETVLSNGKSVALQQTLLTIMANSETQEALTAAGQPRAVLLNPPTVPTAPSFPKPMFLIEVALFSGLIIGGAIVWFLRNQSFTWAAFRLDVISRAVHAKRT